MEKLYKVNGFLAKIWKFGKFQVFVYPMICFALFAAAIVIIAVLQFISTYVK